MKPDRTITPCKRCKGTGKFMQKHFDGEEYTWHPKLCYDCMGKGYQAAYDRRRNAKRVITNGEIYLNLLNRGLAEALTNREEV